MVVYIPEKPVSTASLIKDFFFAVNPSVIGSAHYISEAISCLRSLPFSENLRDVTVTLTVTVTNSDNSSNNDDDISNVTTFCEHVTQGLSYWRV
jgi:hypothetical protein